MIRPSAKSKMSHEATVESEPVRIAVDPDRVDDHRVAADDRPESPELGLGALEVTQGRVAGRSDLVGSLQGWSAHQFPLHVIGQERVRLGESMAGERLGDGVDVH